MKNSNESSIGISIEITSLKILFMLLLYDTIMVIFGGIVARVLHCIKYLFDLLPYKVPVGGDKVYYPLQSPINPWWRLKWSLAITRLSKQKLVNSYSYVDKLRVWMLSAFCIVLVLQLYRDARA